MKKRIAILLLLLAMCSISSVASAEERGVEKQQSVTENSFLPIESLTLDGESLEPSQWPVVCEVKVERLLLPLRDIATSLGWDVTWHDEDRSIVLTNNEHTWPNNVSKEAIVLKIDDKTITRYEEGPMDEVGAVYDPESPWSKGDLSIAPSLINGVTMVPEEVLYEMHCAVHYSYDYQEVHVNAIRPARAPQN